MNRRLRVAVVGAGSMGANHIRVLAEMDGVELAGVVDSDPARAASAVGYRPVPVFETPGALLAEPGPPDFATVAVPTSHHLAVATELLEAGINVLVEKPIAATIAEAEQLAHLAADRDLLLGVGHIERFNPAVVALKQRLEAGQGGSVIQVQARRVGPFPSRIRDVGVIYDLAPHDIDIMRYLLGAEVVRAYAETRQRINTENEDLLAGLLRFSNDVTGTLDINWLTPTKVRELAVLCERGAFVVDYIAQSLVFYENHAATASAGAPRGVTEGPMTRYPVAYREPLRVELEAFRDAVASGGPPPVSAADGIAALRVATALVESAQSGRPVLLDAVPA